MERPRVGERGADLLEMWKAQLGSDDGSADIYTDFNSDFDRRKVRARASG